jgi:hypothetical protein
VNRDSEESRPVSVCIPSDLPKADLARCIALVESGGAVRRGSAAVGIPEAHLIAVVRVDSEVVGVGAIKQSRPTHVREMEIESGELLPIGILEMGYIAVDPVHRGERLSPKIVSALLSEHEGPLFATTDHDRMKATLAKAGFTENKHMWTGQRGQLSLWTKS